jgi:hypothetical protein
LQGQEHLKVRDDLATHNLFEFMCAYLSGIIAERAVARHVHEVRLGYVNPMVLRAQVGGIGWSSILTVLVESSMIPIRTGSSSTAYLKVNPNQYSSCTHQALYISAELDGAQRTVAACVHSLRTNKVQVPTKFKAEQRRG